MKNLTWQNPEQLFVAQELINKVKSKCCGIKVEEIEDNVIEENYIEEDDSDGWGSIDDNPYYNDNLDMDQQSLEFWDNL